MAAGMPVQAVWRSLATQSPPSPRAGHTISYFDKSNQCILFGGASHEDGFYNDVHVLDLASMVWQTKGKGETSNLQSAPARYEHIAAVVRRGGLPHLLVMYGAGHDGVRDDVWALDVETCQWTELKTRGLKPTARTVHSAGHVVSLLGKTTGTKDGNGQVPVRSIEQKKQDRLYVFGGGLSSDSPAPDPVVYCLDVEKLFWVRMTTPEQQPSPCPRLGHSFTAVGGKIYMFGGLDGDQTFDDLWIFDTVQKIWNQPETFGDRPSARSGHTASVVGTRIYIFGGFIKHPQPKVYDDIYVLDTESLVWSQLDTAAHPPGPPCAVLDHDACTVYSIVGVDTDVDQQSAKSRLQNGIMVFGGMDLSGMYNYLFRLEIS